MIIGGVPILGSTNSGPYPLVQGVHVIVMGMDDTRPDDDVSHLHPILSIFDLSRRGRNDLGGGGAELKVLFEDGEGLSLPGDEGLVEWGFDSLSNGMLEYLVSCFRFGKWLWTNAMERVIILFRRVHRTSGN